jgi:LuxR family maltose regulon positive regulatory protein
LAAVMFDRDQLGSVRSLLANRLDVIERTGAPDAIMLAYQVLAGAATAEGDERYALEILDSLFVLGEAKRLPRLMLAAIAAKIRVHALRSRTETLRGLIAQLDGLSAVFSEDDYRLFLPAYKLSASIAKTYVALAAFDPAAADKHLKRADALAASTHRRDALRILVLRAVTARQRGSDRALGLLSEALDLAKIGGIDRLVVDIHPQAVAMAAELGVGQGVQIASPIDPAQTTRPMETSPRRPTPSAGLLTPKEAEVLGLLNAGLSNKLIANTMDISDETVNWHLKNLFSKLSAGTRKHAVDRARLLGLAGA